MKLIYFHGFGSSAASGTIRTLRNKLPDFEVIVPDIPVDPAEALPFLRELCSKEQPNVIAGTSKGACTPSRCSVTTASVLIRPSLCRRPVKC